MQFESSLAYVAGIDVFFDVPITTTILVRLSTFDAFVECVGRIAGVINRRTVLVVCWSFIVLSYLCSTVAAFV